MNFDYKDVDIYYNTWMLKRAEIIGQTNNKI